MKWVTREHAKVDRVACPWLIVKYIDPEAEFLYVPAGEVQSASERERAVSYDAPGARYGHRDGLCTFEVLMEEYGLTDSALRRMAHIVHGADIASEVECVPEAAGLKALAEGYALSTPDDHEKLKWEFSMYDALYAWCRGQEERGARLGRLPA